MIDDGPLTIDAGRFWPLERDQSSLETHQVVPPSLLGLGRAWTRIGYAVLVLAVLAFFAMIVVRPMFALPPGGHVPDGYRLVSGKEVAKEGGLVVRASSFGFACLFLYVFSALAGLGWTLVDIVDRRKRFVWLLPMFICPLVLSLQAVPLALYLFFARETIGHGEGVQ